MKAFEVYRNGRKVCTAGLPKAGVVTANITWAKFPDPKISEDLDFRVGGLISQSRTFVDWAYGHLKVGDELRIVVCERTKVSKPKKSRTESEATRKKQKLEYLKRLAKELSYEIKPG